MEVGNTADRYNETTLMYNRFSSFLDSYHTANYGVVAVCLSIGMIYNTKGFSRFFAYVFLLISLLAVILSRQRVAVFTGALIAFFFFIKKSGKNVAFNLLMIFIIVYIVVLLIYTFGDELYIYQITDLFKSGFSMNSLMKGRDSQWFAVMEGQTDYVFGHGLGAGGHLANSIGVKPAVCDGSYFKILLETGLLSIILFLYLIIHSLLLSIKSRTFFSTESMIVFFFMFTFIGANVIDFTYITPLFWYAIGRIVSKKYQREKILKLQ